MAVMSGGQAIARSVRSYDVDTIFAIPGVQLDYLFDALYDEQDAIRIIHPRHEQAAAYMAFGYAQSTGKVGTCLVVPGPGVLNASAALSTAYACNAPVLCLTGQIPSQFIDKGYGLLHEIADQPGTMAAVTKWQGRANTPGEAPEVIREAFRQLNTGRRRPVLFEMAPDVMKAEGEVALLDPVTTYDDPDPDPDLIEQAAAMLGAAENPGIFVGGGIFGAEAELKALAETVQAPVFMSPQGLGAIDYRDPLAQNLRAGNEVWADIDVALVVGTRFFHQLTDWGGMGDGKMIRVDIDPVQSVGMGKPDIHIVTTAKKALAALADRVQRHNISRPSRADELNALKAKVDKEFTDWVKPQHELATAIRNVLPEDGFITFGVTQLGFYSWYTFPTYQPRTNIQPGYQGTLGYAFPTALGVQVANPSRKSVCVIGDGGFMFGVQELATAMQHDIGLVTIVFNDGAFGNVRRYQRTTFNERFIASDLRNPDFMKLADAFGMRGLSTDNPAGLQAALEEAFKSDEPALIEVKVGEMPNPFKYFARKKVR